MKLYFSEVNNVSTPRSAKEPISLDSIEVVEVFGRLAEALLINETVIVPIYGPAIELVTLMRWFSQNGVDELIETGGIRFCFCPGTFAFISERNKKELSLEVGPGVTFIKGHEDAWENIKDSVILALTEQLNYPLGKSRRFAKRIAKVTDFCSFDDIFNRTKNKIYEQSIEYLNNIMGLKDIYELGKLDNGHDQKAVRTVMNIAHANLDLECSSTLSCSALYGNDMTWQLIDNNICNQMLNQTKDKLNTILEFEGVPNIPELVKRGWPAHEIIKLRTDKKVEEFRQFIYNIKSDAEKDVLKAYYESFKHDKSDNIPTKILRLGVPTAIGLLGVAGTVASTALSAIDTFWGDSFFSGWNPKIFIDKHFKYKNE